MLTNLLLRGNRGPSPSSSTISLFLSLFAISARSFSILSFSNFFCFSRSIFSRPSRIHAGKVLRLTASRPGTKTISQCDAFITAICPMHLDYAIFIFTKSRCLWFNSYLVGGSGPFWSEAREPVSSVLWSFRPIRCMKAGGGWSICCTRWRCSMLTGKGNKCD